MRLVSLWKIGKYKFYIYSKNKILMTQRRLHEFSTVTIDEWSLTNYYFIVTVLNSRNGLIITIQDSLYGS